jgi:hypothetical protein
LIKSLKTDQQLLQLSYSTPYTKSDVSSKIVEFFVQSLKNKIEKENISNCFNSETSWNKLENHSSIRDIINFVFETMSNHKSKIPDSSGSSSRKTDQNTQSSNHTAQLKRKTSDINDNCCHKTDQNTQSSNHTSNDGDTDNYDNDNDNDYSCSSNNNNQYCNSNSAFKKSKNNENGNETLFQKYGGTAGVCDPPQKNIKVDDIPIVLMINNEWLIINKGLDLINKQLERNLATDSHTPHDGK